MKSKNDFESEEEYHEYLTHYYAGQAIQGYLSSYAGLTAQPPPALIAINSVEIGRMAIKHLKGEEVIKPNTPKK